MATQGQLPPEIFRRITDHLYPMYDNPTLASLARTSRTLQPVAERLLYSSLYIIGSQHLSAILTSFLSRPVLASYPRQIYVNPIARRGERTTQTYWEELTELLLRGGAHLDTFSILCQDIDTAFATWILRSLRDASGGLRTLRVPFWWDTEVCEFLESPGAAGLTRLETGDMHPMIMGTGGQQLPAPITLHRGAVPHLRILEAPPSALCLLVPGRPVTHVKVRLGPATTVQTLPPPLELVGECLVRSTAPTGVIALDLGDLSAANRVETYSLEVMELAPQFLPNLEFIGKINFPMFRDLSMSRLQRPLIRLFQLHTLELAVNMEPQVDGYWELATAWDLRMYSPSLRQLVFFKGFDRHRWVWHEEESDFVLAANQDVYYSWGGI